MPVYRAKYTGKQRGKNGNSTVEVVEVVEDTIVRREGIGG